MDISTLAFECQQQVNPQVIEAIIDIESSRKPFALAMVGGGVRQPRSESEAYQQLDALRSAGKNVSAGLMQINIQHFDVGTSIFDPCTNIGFGARILKECHDRVKIRYKGATYQEWLERTASCYFSGNFNTGYRLPEGNPYVHRFRVAYARHIHTNKRK
ncbi:transglycosylase SLT domain-containing protein, partial [Vibrio sp. 10N.261.46.E12]|uniref:transglycosylase SLT domain-containing protein n=1 Tax=unclassified Vibrio TaxID=2614977 RepID=UPI000C82BD97